ncbi:hypothetical protein [Bacillus tuaregi]|uniref:hypothetical protein n=1 Tax=Bacillus tuaregi TaxID=1816695 RepID=UPI0008F8E475|nr:hypothetical protein [Bacillus tuaregi]
MKATVIGREELIDMFEEMNHQLEQLDKSIKTNMSQQQDEWQRIQEQRIAFCDEQLETLEKNMTSLKERKEQPKKSLKLTLSY